MPNRLEELAQVLKQQADAHAALLALEEDKRKAIIANNTAALDEITKQQTTLADIARQNEASRVSAVSCAALELSLPPNAKLLDIIAAAGREAEPLVGLRVRLSDLLGQLRHRSRQNAELLRRSIEHINAFFASLGEARTLAPVYHRDGKKSGTCVSMLDQMA